MKKLFVGLLSLAILLVAAPVCADVFGQTGFLDKAVGGVGLEREVSTSMAKIIQAVLAVVGTIFLLLTVVAGILWMTAAGQEEKIEKAKKILVGSVIGLVIILSAYTITYFVTARLGGAGGGGAGSEPCCCHIDDPARGLVTMVTDPQVCQETAGYQFCSASEVDTCE